MAVSRGTKEAVINVVHQNAIFTETVKKEMRHFKVYDSYTINLENKKPDYPAGKVNSWDEPVEGDDEQTDEVFRRCYRRSRMVPTEKYTKPQTTSQEVGWITQPLVPLDRSDRRIYFPLRMSDMTRFMEFFWSIENRQRLNVEEKLAGQK